MRCAQFAKDHYEITQRRELNHDHMSIWTHASMIGRPRYYQCAISSSSSIQSRNRRITHCLISQVEATLVAMLHACHAVCQAVYRYYLTQAWAHINKKINKINQNETRQNRERDKLISKLIFADEAKHKYNFFFV